VLALARRFGLALFLAAYFFWFTRAGLRAPFTGDDLMNLNFHLTPSFPHLLLSNLTYWSTAYRPMGGVFYVLIYRLTGFHPMPFRIFCFAILLLNLWLVYRVCLRLTERREIAALATMLVTYHAWMVNLYYSTGTIYELLCFAFYFAAFDYYLGIRQAGKMLSARQWIWFVALYICALNSKELAATLPLCILCYEAIWHRLKNSARLVTVSALVTLPYVIGKLSGPDSLAATNPAYKPAVSASRYLHTFHLYLNVLFYQDHFFRDANTIILVALMLGLAIWTRSRTLLFAWLFILFSVLPFIFIPHYSGFFLYLPMVGWALYAATGMEMLRERFAKSVPAVVVVVVVALALAPLHARESRKSVQVFTSAELPTAQMIAELNRVQPRVPKGARLFFESDPFPEKTFSLLFLVREFYNDQTLDAARAKDGDQFAGGRFDAVFQWRDGKLTAGGH
jgi:hypothetical protein